MNKFFFSVSIITVILFSGCSSKNIFLPGKSRSSCDIANGSHGVCGNPLDIYENRSKVKNLKTSEDVAYRVEKDGKIIAIDPNTGETVDEDKSENVKNSSFVTAGSLDIKDRNFMLPQSDQGAMIRNQEVIRKIWVNTYRDKNDNLTAEHNIYVVTKKPSWLIGEKTPSNVKKVKVIPSIIAKEAIMESHKVDKFSDENVLNNYLKDVNPTDVEDQILNQYLKEK